MLFWIKTIQTAAWFYLLMFALLAGSAHAAELKPADQTGFLIVAADRGFVGNEEIRDAFASFSANHPAALVFVTDERTRQTLQSGLASLHQQNIGRIVVLPLFISAAEPRYQLIRTLVTEENQTIPVTFTKPYGESYFAVEALATRLRGMQHTAQQHLLVVGYGAQNDTHRRAMYDDWMRIVKQASQGVSFRSINSLILLEAQKDEEPESYGNKTKQQLATALSSLGTAAKNNKNQVIAFALGPKYDSMMSLESRLERLLPENAALNHFEIEPQHLAMWMEREASRNLPLAEEDTGVILFAHGSDFHWNENLRVAVEPLMKRYKIEFAFSMADPYTIERALHKLEQRGAKAAIVVSAFASRSSYRNEIGYLAGLDIENQDDHIHDNNSGHGSHGGHGGHAKSSTPVPRILTSLPVIWTGGYEDNPLFASALFDRVLALSKDPARETVILTAHGTQDDRKNDEWLEKLNSIASQMHDQGGQKFKAFKVATWREDWPDKRAPWVKKVRAMVTEASKQGDRVIVIPARTTSVGPEKRFLAGLEFELGEGFAPHPLFTQWVDEQIRQGINLHKEALGH
ncbi:sirohydrochlorin chelatase [Nitrosomonas europaea]|uniref:sirohydrochlorin chelatase n=1 Tax=Nitrosomonas europaea TaxID=915 RepID=UPI000791FAC6|nr:CbiX/SirB N-terminal domain-containing protein [Nitrosomonas europaea]KXK43708.1 MAG: cobalamin (vitamin B12) biosynthesis CbiX protein [Nitrosomonas europaea]